MALLSESPESKMPTIFTFTRLRSVEDLPVFPVPPFVLSSAPTAIAVIASIPPVRRATRIDPAIVLREE